MKSAVLFNALLHIFSCSWQFDDTAVLFSHNCVVVHTSDQMSSAGIAVVSLDTLECRVSSSGTLHTDASLYAFHNSIYVLNRLGRDNIQLLNPYDNYATVSEVSLHRGGSGRPNPHGMAFTEYNAFITCYDDSHMAVYDIVDNRITERIDLSRYGYNSTVPCMSALYYNEETGLLYAALQRLDRHSFVPSDYSLIISLDPVNHSVVQESAIEAEGALYTNPYSKFRLVESGQWHHANSALSILMVSCTGHFSVTGRGGEDGAVVAAFLDSDGIITRYETVVTETKDYGDIVDFLYSENKLYLVTLNSNEVSFFISYNIDERTYTELLKNSSAGYIWRIEMDSEKRIFLCDRNVYNPGIRVFNTLTGRWEGPVINTGLPPNDLLIVEE